MRVTVTSNNQLVYLLRNRLDNSILCFVHRSKIIIIHRDDGSCVGLSVFPDCISEINAARITKLDITMFYDESWKPIYFVVKRSKVKVITSVSVFRQNTISPFLVRKPRTVFPAVQCPKTMLATPGFFCVTFPSLAAGRWFFPRRGFFAAL